MDISKKYSTDTIVIDEFYFPDGERITDKDGKPCWIETSAPNSDQYIAAVAKQSREAAAKNKGGHKRAKNSGLTESEYRDAIDSGIAFLASLAVNWGGWEIDKKPADFSVANVAELYRNAPFVRKDVDDAYKDDTAFFAK